jgi:hypothetical protein
MAQSNQNTDKKLPSHTVYWVPEREKSPWTRIGVLWPHADGKGFSEHRDLEPAANSEPGRVVIRVYEPKADQGDQA